MLCHFLVSLRITVAQVRGASWNGTRLATVSRDTTGTQSQMKAPHPQHSIVGMVWELQQSPLLVHQTHDHERYAMCVAWLPSCALYPEGLDYHDHCAQHFSTGLIGLLITGGLDGAAHAYNIAQSFARCFTVKHDNAICSLTAHPDGGFITTSWDL